MAPLRTCTLLVLYTAASGSGAPPLDASAALQVDDECGAGDDQGACSLNALQLRGAAQGTPAAGHESGDEADASQQHPEQACNTVDNDYCLQSAPTWSSASACASRTSFCSSYAKDMHRCCPVACGAFPVCTVEACNALGGKGTCTYPIPEDEEKKLAATLAAEAFSSGGNACAHAPEGQLCVSSNIYIYCSAKRQIGKTYCEQQKGPRSLCKQGGIGLTRNYCDDPFCRNGGARHGDGYYCHSGNVVVCHGQNAPYTHSSCGEDGCNSAWGEPRCNPSSRRRGDDFMNDRRRFMDDRRRFGFSVAKESGDGGDGDDDDFDN